MTFGNRKFIGSLGAATAVIVAEYVLVLSDSVIAGRTLGESALVAVNLLTPVFSGASFFTWMLALGTAIVYSDAMARMQRERAANIAGQGLAAAFALGGALALAVFALKAPYLAFISPDASASALALEYWRWYPLVVFLEAVDLVLLYLVYTDGGETCCAFSYCTQVAVNVTVSYGLCAGKWCLPQMGMAGISIGTAVAWIAGIAVLVPRLADRRRCSVRFAPKFMPRELARSLKSSFGDASAGLFQAVLFFLITKYVVYRWGTESLPAVTVAFLVVRLSLFFNGVGIALQPLETVYHGEGNTTGLKSLLKFAAGVSCVEGLCFSVLVLAVPELFVDMVGIEGPETAAAAAHAARVTVLGLTGYAIAYLLNSHYQYVERPDKSIGLTALAFFAVPAALLLVFGAVSGMDGVWIALAAGPALSLVPFLCSLKKKQPEKDAPSVWSARLSDIATTASVVRAIGDWIGKRYSSKTVEQATDIVALAFKRILGFNRQAGGVHAEVCVKPAGRVLRLIIRDDGEHFAIHIPGCDSMHLPAAGFNRNIFTIAAEKPGFDDLYEVLRGYDATPADMAAVTALDARNYCARYHMPPDYTYALFQSNRESGVAIRERRTNEIVGYTMLLPVSAETYASLRSGRIDDSLLKPEEVLHYSSPGIYDLYFASVVVHEEHRHASTLLALLNAMAEMFLEMAGRGIFIRRMMADVVSRDGVKFCRLFGLDKIRDTDHDSAIYEVTALPPMFRATTPVTRRLASAYGAKFDSMNENDSGFDAIDADDAFNSVPDRKPLCTIALLATAIICLAHTAAAGVKAAIEPENPWEGFNRAMFAVQRGAMDYVVEPLSHVYFSIIPRPLAEGVDNALGNIRYPVRFFASLARGEWGASGDETLRFCINSTLGLCGFFDPAAEWFGIFSSGASFSGTFAAWGIGKGPALTLPFLPAAHVRDTAGCAVDACFEPMTWLDILLPTRTGIGWTAALWPNGVAMSVAPWEAAVSGSADPYETYLWRISLKSAVDERLGSYRYLKSLVAGEDDARRPPVAAAAQRPAGLKGRWRDVAGYAPRTPALDTFRLRLFSPKRDDDFWWMRQSVFNGDFANDVERREVAIADGLPAARYGFVPAPEGSDGAPLVFVIPGLGGAFDSPGTLAMAEMLRDAGAAAVLVDCPFQPCYVRSANRGVLPGNLPEDAARLADFMSRILADLADAGCCATGDVSVVGWSMGGVATAHLAALAHRGELGFGVRTFLAVNPPVAFGSIADALDSFAAPSAGWSLEEAGDRFVDTATRVMVWDELRFDDTPDITDEAARFANVCAICDSLSETASCATNSAVVASVRDYMALAAPGNAAETAMASDLASVEDALRCCGNLKMIHTRDDYLLTDADRDWLDGVLGERIVWFSCGAHCGMLHTPEFREEVLDALSLSGTKGLDEHGVFYDT